MTWASAGAPHTFDVNHIAGLPHLAVFAGIEQVFQVEVELVHLPVVILPTHVKERILAHVSYGLQSRRETDHSSILLKIQHFCLPSASPIQGGGGGVPSYLVTLLTIVTLSCYV